MSEPRLWRLHFDQKTAPTGGSEPDASGKLELRLSLTVARLEQNRVGIELTVNVEMPPNAAATASYRASFALAGGWADLGPDELEERLVEIARGVAPAALYPYLREAIGSAAYRAGLSRFTLPIVNFREAFADQGVDVPPYEAAATDTLGEADNAEPSPRPKRPRSRRK